MDDILLELKMIRVEINELKLSLLELKIDEKKENEFGSTIIALGTIKSLLSGLIKNPKMLTAVGVVAAGAGLFSVDETDHVNVEVSRDVSLSFSEKDLEMVDALNKNIGDAEDTGDTGIIGDKELKVENATLSYGKISRKIDFKKGN